MNKTDIAFSYRREIEERVPREKQPTWHLIRLRIDPATGNEIGPAGVEE